MYSVNRFARASRSCGFDAGLLILTSSTGSMMPIPKKCDHTMLDKFLEKNGFNVAYMTGVDAG
ncbi:MAG: hypothetical protein ACPGNW_07490, partial [Verrucomicrobiales bacterium]